MQLIFDQSKILLKGNNNKIDELPSKLKLVTNRGVLIKECILCTEVAIFKQGLTVCRFCNWESRRPSEAIAGLFKHIIRIHSNIDITRYWIQQNQCVLCNAYINTRCGITDHLIMQHIEGIAEHRYCSESRSVYDKRNSCKLLTEYDFNADKRYIRFDLSDCKATIQRIHEASSFCLLCLKDDITKEVMQRGYLFQSKDNNKSVFQQRQWPIAWMLQCVKKHELEPWLRLCAKTAECPLCDQSFSSQYIVYHHVLFGHLLKEISHKSLTGDCILENKVSNEEIMNNCDPLLNKQLELLEGDLINFNATEGEVIDSVET